MLTSTKLFACLDLLWAVKSTTFLQRLDVLYVRLDVHVDGYTEKTLVKRKKSWAVKFDQFLATGRRAT